MISMKNLFWYRKEVKRKVKTEKPEDADDTWTSVEQEIVDIYWDCFNLANVVRGQWQTPDLFLVLLDDGHEQADDVEKPKLNAKRQIVGIDVKRERAWFVSQIALVKEDVERFRKVSEVE